MNLFTPIVGEVYRNCNGLDYKCISVHHNGRATMRRVKDNWTLVAVGIRQYEDGAIEWDYSLAGCWT